MGAPMKRGFSPVPPPVGERKQITQPYKGSIAKDQPPLETRGVSLIYIINEKAL